VLSSVDIHHVDHVYSGGREGNTDCRLRLCKVRAWTVGKLVTGGSEALRAFLTDIWGKEIWKDTSSMIWRGLYFTSKTGVFWISKVLSGICDVILIWE
jgi:hypothetical protein